LVSDAHYLFLMTERTRRR